MDAIHPFPSLFEIQGFSLSEAIEKLASNLAFLSAIGREDDADLAASTFAGINLLVDSIAPQFKQSGESFAAIGAIDSSMSICSRSYASAHHAVVGEAERFLSPFWFHVDPEGFHAASRKRDEIQHWSDGTGLHPSMIIDRWDKAKPGILELLPREWQKEFASIESRVLRERAAALNNQNSPPAGGTGTAATLNTRMIDTLQRNTEARDWTVRQWAVHLSCGKSTVAETATWKDLQKLREEQRLDRKE